jgi:hypothetical protein
MTTVELTAPMRPAADQPVVVRAVTVIMGTVVGLTFMFGFGNVLNLALRLGVPIWVAPPGCTRSRPVDPRPPARHPAPRPARRNA